MILLSHIIEIDSFWIAKPKTKINCPYEYYSFRFESNIIKLKICVLEYAETMSRTVAVILTKELNFLRKNGEIYTCKYSIRTLVVALQRVVEYQGSHSPHYILEETPRPFCTATKIFEKSLVLLRKDHKKSWIRFNTQPGSG